MTKPFDYVNSINFTKKNLMTDTYDDQQAEKEYVPFLTNRSLSYFPESILYAQEMNINHHLDNKLQYEYLLHSVPKGKRFAKWHKRDVSKIANAFANHFNCSVKTATDMCKVMSTKEVDELYALIQQTGGY